MIFNWLTWLIAQEEFINYPSSGHMQTWALLSLLICSNNTSQLATCPGQLQKVQNPSLHSNCNTAY
jgi:hypothetical protein